NSAEYSSSSVGVNVNTTASAEYNEKGVTPNIGVTASDDASSTTKSAIASGTIEVKSGNTDLSTLSRDTTNSLNALGKIFDKKTVSEKQELATLFGEVAYEQVHKLSVQNGWTDSSPEKIALHALVGGIMADLGGGSITSGVTGAAVNELVQSELEKRFKNNPDMWQWASAIIGATAAKLTGGDAQTGASTAASGTKNNAQLIGDPFELYVLGLEALGFVVVVEAGVQVIKNKAGEVIASWSSTANGWVDSAGNWICDNAGDFYIWAKSGGQLKRVPDKVIQEKGGEEWTQGLKEKTGKSGSDLYWDPKTGDVYSVPKNKKFSGSPEWVGNIND
ncbi:MAG: Hemagglutinin repeat protein, partial [Firmicutes bacterium]|nr:Hemagglutinin repeat protein [Bacillota bacterium]